MSAMHCKTCGQDSAELLRQNDDLRERIRLARANVARRNAPRSAGVSAALAELYDILDLRKPLPKRGRR